MATAESRRRPGPGGRTRRRARPGVVASALLLVAVSLALADVDLGLGRDDGDEAVTLRWWVPALEWCAGTAAGTGLFLLREEVGRISIPSTGTPVDLFVAPFNYVALPIALSPEFGCATGCEAVALMTHKEGSVWTGYSVGAMFIAATEPLGGWVRDRTGSMVLGYLVPAAIGSIGAAAAYNVGWWFGDIPSDMEEQSIGAGVMWERRSLFRQTVMVEAPCGIATGAFGGVLLSEGLHSPPDSQGVLAPPARTFNRVVDVGLLYPLTTMVGIEFAASAMGRRNGFWLGYLGASVGTAAVWGVGALTGFDGQLDKNPYARILPAVAAGAIAAVGYNLFDDETAVADNSERFTGPTLAGAVPSRGRAGIDFDLRLATLRF